MTLNEFDHGYWYAAELKSLATELGVRHASKLRKDELEASIRGFLVSGKLVQPRRGVTSSGPVSDVERGLSLRLRVMVYTNDAETKEFLERESRRLAPEHKQRSGSRYRLNRWREEQIAGGAKITYGDLVREYVRLNRPEVVHERAPQVCYINFLSDFFAAEKDAVRADGLRAWAELKKLDGPKTYREWKQARARRSSSPFNGVG
jgi:SAP domain-containing new25